MAEGASRSPGLFASSSSPVSVSSGMESGGMVFVTPVLSAGVGGSDCVGFTGFCAYTTEHINSNVVKQNTLIAPVKEKHVLNLWYANARKTI